MRILLLILALVFVFNTYSQNIKEVTILHWNDFHARNQPFKVSKKDPETGKKINYFVGGVGSMTGYLNKYRSSSSLVLNGGDDFQGTPISNFTSGRSQIEILNSYNLDAFVLGNHEFDYGRLPLDSALSLAQFDVLSANVYMKSEQKLIARPYTTKEVNGVKFGIIGITLPELFETSMPVNIEGLLMLNTDSVITSAISELKSHGCDVIILLTHIGLEADKKLADKFYPDVDIIVGGHSHIALSKPVIRNGVVIVQAGSQGRNLGKLDLKIDIDKDTLISSYGTLIETVLDSSIFDKESALKIENMIAQYLPEMNTVIGKLETDWKASYSAESNLGQFEADAFRIKTGADIGFINGGGLRKSLFKGDILISDIWEINPFGNEIQIITVSGKALKQMLKNNIKIRIEKKRSGEGSELMQNSGLTYSYDSQKAIGGSEEFLVSVNIGRTEVDDGRLYTIATNSYVISQFKKFFGEINEPVIPKETGYIDRDLLIEYIKEIKVINNVLGKRTTDVSR